ncbi:hypothetical protein D9756_000678 [Leucocoprinus leucothites]|uniref:Uncharacterized protein n=1 Tax=Leucocoprinus leucothites TaxID=201217 RepID=A0A8H5GFS4_9AGAR|nr:hypothetical protein D9756_000678 [Leucoagaricus leucothites]
MHSSGEDHPLLVQGTEQGYDDSAEVEEILGGREETEKALLRKVDFRMSFLVFLIILNYVDRTNAAAARLRGFEEDLGLEGTQFSSVLSIFYVGYVVVQIPSSKHFTESDKQAIGVFGLRLVGPWCNHFLYRNTNFCPWKEKKSDNFRYSYHQALLARFLLGFAEAPFYSGAMFFLGRWYKRNELSERMAYLVCGMLFSIAFGTLIASFILDVMEGVLGLPAWHWLFFVEGGLTTVSAIAAMFILPDFPETKSISWLSPAEHTLARRRMVEDSSGTPDLPVRATSGFYLAISDWKVWYLAAAMFFETVSTSFMIFFPTLTATMGYSTTSTLLLCAPPWLAAAASSIWLSRHSDRMQERCMHVIIPFMIAICGFLLAMATMNTAIRYVSLLVHPPFYFLFSSPFHRFFMAQSSISDVTFFAWASSTVGDPPAKRAVALALINAIAQGANIAGAYVWVTEWGPTYTKSFLICTVTFLVTILMCLYLREALKRLNHKMDFEDEPSGLQVPYTKGWRYHT